MSAEDLRLLEEGLGITLPESYRRLMVPFPVPYLRGNNSAYIWDNAEALIVRNREVHSDGFGSRQPWPPHWFFIGDPLASWAYAIDLRDPAAPVLYVDHY